MKTMFKSIFVFFLNKRISQGKLQVQKSLTSDVTTRKASIVCSTDQFLWCEYSHHGPLQAVNLRLLNPGLGTVEHNLLL